MGHGLVTARGRRTLWGCWVVLGLLLVPVGDGLVYAAAVVRNVDQGS